MSWKLDQARLDAATELGEQISEQSGFREVPIDPIVCVEREWPRLCAAGADFGEAFDGRLEYDGQRFFLFYNTKYDGWSHIGSNHPKVRFTIAHELGHFYLDSHREFLLKGGGAHGSCTDFLADTLVEREADCFAAGLLMPSYLLGHRVNEEPPCLGAVKAMAERFQVSLTSMLVRWIQLSDFPCALACVRQGKIEWGFLSAGYRRFGFYRVRRGSIVSSAAMEFFRIDPRISRYRVGDGWAETSEWFDGNGPQVEVKEEYVSIPQTSQMFVLISSDENDLARSSDSNDDDD